MIKTHGIKITLFGDSNKPTNIRSLLTLGDSKLKIPWSPFLNVRWEDISMKMQQGCNLAGTLNPDIRVDFDVFSDTCKDKLLQVIWKLKSDNILKKIILVKEYGQTKDGKTKTQKEGKLHFHFMCKVSDRQVFEKALLKIFNKRCQLSHRTLQTKLFRTVEDRSRYYNYLKKEEHNTKQCLLCF